LVEGDLGPYLTHCGQGLGYLHAKLGLYILIHPTDWPQYTNVTDRTGQTDRQTTVE